MEWFRWYHGACSDDKWPLIAKKANVPQAFVVAVWAMLLEVASQDEERGSIEEFDPEAVDALLGMPDGAAEAILDALSTGKHPRIIDGCISSWVRRQPKRERTSEEPSTTRVQQHRKRQKENGNATLHHVTPCNTMKHQETPRTEKIREELNTQESSLRSDSSPEPSAMAAEVAAPEALDAVITLPLNTGAEHPVTKGEVEQWQDLYPAVDVLQELRNMRGWLMGNPTKKKTKAGVGRFIHAWLAKEQDKPRAVDRLQGGARASPHLRQMSVTEQNQETIVRVLAQRAERQEVANGWQ